jgi:hypothetical protein
MSTSRYYQKPTLPNKLKNIMKHPMHKYAVHFRKDNSLSPAERRCIRRNAHGIWLFGDWVTAPNPHAACAALRLKMGLDGYKLRAYSR